MKKVVLFLTVFGCFIAGNANAGGISGYYFTWGSIDAVVEIKGTGKTSDGDRVTLNGTMQDIEYVCQNPGTNNYVVDGTPGRYEVDGGAVITGADIQKGGKAIVRVTIEIDEGDLGLACVNPNWTPKPGSAAPKQLNLSIIWSDCSGDKHNVPETCIDEAGPVAPSYVLKDQVEVECILDPIMRDTITLLPTKGQEYECKIDNSTP